jgi:membrane protein required for colicin V production
MDLTLLDGIVIAIVLISAILAMVRGFVREVLSVAAWLAAAGAAYYLYQPFLPVVSPYIENQTVAQVVSAAIIFFVALIIASYVTMKISNMVVDSRVGVIDRILGFAFGVARGVLLLVISYLFLDWLIPEPPQWIADAQTRPFLEDAGARLVAVLPDDLEETFLRRLRGEDEPLAPGQQGQAPVPPNEIGPGYGQGSRGGLDQLFGNGAGAPR